MRKRQRRLSREERGEGIERVFFIRLVLRISVILLITVGYTDGLGLRDRGAFNCSRDLIV